MDSSRRIASTILTLAAGVIVIMGLKMFLRLCPSEARAFHWGQIAQRQPFSPMPPTGDVIDAEFHRL